jgi:hypothetical protein
MSDEEKTDRFNMRVAPSFIRAIDDWRRKQPDIPTRAEAIRRLCLLAIAAKLK